MRKNDATMPGDAYPVAHHHALTSDALAPLVTCQDLPIFQLQVCSAWARPGLIGSWHVAGCSWHWRLLEVIGPHLPGMLPAHLRGMPGMPPSLALGCRCPNVLAAHPPDHSTFAPGREEFDNVNLRLHAAPFR